MSIHACKPVKLKSVRRQRHKSTQAVHSRRGAVFPRRLTTNSSYLPRLCKCQSESRALDLSASCLIMPTHNLGRQQINQQLRTEIPHHVESLQGVANCPTRATWLVLHLTHQPSVVLLPQIQQATYFVRFQAALRHSGRLLRSFPQSLGCFAVLLAPGFEGLDEREDGL